MSDDVLKAYLASFQGDDHGNLAQVISLQWKAYRKLSDEDLNANLSRWMDQHYQEHGFLPGGGLAKNWKEAKDYLPADDVDNTRNFADLYGNTVMTLGTKLYLYYHPELLEAGGLKVAKGDPVHYDAVIEFVKESQNELIISLLLHEWSRRLLKDTPAKKYRELRSEFVTYERQFNEIEAEQPKLFRRKPKPEPEEALLPH